MINVFFFSPISQRLYLQLITERTREGGKPVTVTMKGDVKSYTTVNDDGASVFTGSNGMKVRHSE